LHKHGRTVPISEHIIPGLVEAIPPLGVRLITSIVIDHLAIIVDYYY